MGTCRQRLPGLQPTQSQPAQQIRDQVFVNVNTDAEMQPTSSPSPKIWGTHTNQDVHHTIDAIYDEIVFWRRNLFMLPSGAVGKKFVSETTK